MTRVMRLPWSDEEARGRSGLDLLVSRSNLLGQDPTIVNWKGGNTSAKVDDVDHAGKPVRVLWVKGSGSDLRTMTSKDFVGLRLDEILLLQRRQAMSDEEMVQYLGRCALRPDVPRPSIETLLHAFLPFAHIDHTHPDAVIAFCTADGGEAVTRQVFGDRVVWIPYRRPGFTLSRAVAEAVRDRPRAQAVFLAKHGLVTWGEDARACYEATVAIVEEAEQAVARRAPAAAFGGPRVSPAPPDQRDEILTSLLPRLRGALSVRRPATLHVDAAPDVLEFVSSEHLSNLAVIGAACPDHLVHTKYLPCVVPADPASGGERLVASCLDAVTRYADAYRSYVATHRHQGDPEGDPFPRVVLLPGLGMVTTGPHKEAAMRTGDLYHRAIAVMRGATALSSFTSLTPQEAYDVEYWPLELYKLTLAPPPRELTGRVALVTGGAGGIGRAVADRLAAEGAHVGVMDLDDGGARDVVRDLESRFGTGRALALPADVTREEQVIDAFRHLVLAYGGVDIVVSNAGLALARAVEETSVGDWDRVFGVLARGYFLISREAFRVIKAQERGGAIVFITSKNALLAGKNSSAYNAAKAAEQQLMRSLAEEGGAASIRVNAVAPDAVLRGSKIWSGEWRKDRAKDYGIEERDLEEFYRNRTTLKVTVSPEDVAEAVLFLVSARSSKTTGCTITVDGGVPGAYTR
jgi:rhamnulose-1-phosphate aldolase/alcohol dehydrogenase